jgi:hypothetical protein
VEEPSWSTILRPNCASKMLARKFCGRGGGVSAARSARGAGFEMARDVRGFKRADQHDEGRGESLKQQGVVDFFHLVLGFGESSSELRLLSCSLGMSPKMSCYLRVRLSRVRLKIVSPSRVVTSCNRCYHKCVEEFFVALLKVRFICAKKFMDRINFSKWNCVEKSLGIIVHSSNRNNFLC